MNGGHADRLQVFQTHENAGNPLVLRRPVDRLNDVAKLRLLGRSRHEARQGDALGCPGARLHHRAFQRHDEHGALGHFRRMENQNRRADRNANQHEKHEVHAGAAQKIHCLPRSLENTLHKIHHGSPQW